jgi:hypothetical protein
MNKYKVAIFAVLMSLTSACVIANSSTQPAQGKYWLTLWLDDVYLIGWGGLYFRECRGRRYKLLQDWYVKRDRVSVTCTLFDPLASITKGEE